MAESFPSPLHTHRFAGPASPVPSNSPLAQLDATASLLDPTRNRRRQPSSIERLLSDEIILRIWQFLAAVDLTRLQSVCRRLGSLAGDSQIWKALFLRNFVEGELSSADSGGASHSLERARSRRPCLPRNHLGAQSTGAGSLPDRYFLADRQKARNLSPATPSDYSVPIRDADSSHWPQDRLDWQALFRVSSNWQKGNFTLSELPAQEDHRSPASPTQATQLPPTPHNAFSLRSTPGHSSLTSRDLSASRPERAYTLVESVGEYIFTASRCSDEIIKEEYSSSDEYLTQLPCVRMHRISPKLDGGSVRSIAASSPSGQSSFVCSITSKRSNPVTPRKGPTLSITDMKVDATSSTSDVRLFVAYSTGDWSVFCISPPPSSASIGIRPSPAVTEIQCCKPTSRELDSVGEVVMTSFHWPILAMCSSGFTISVFNLGDLQQSADALVQPDPPMLVRQMKGLSCHWPATMTLTEIPMTQMGRGTSERPLRLGKRKRTASNHSEHGLTLAAGSAAPLLGGQMALKDLSRAYRLDIAYSSASYPNTWSISLQEIVVVLAHSKRAKALSGFSRCATARFRLSSHLAPESSDGGQDLKTSVGAPAEGTASLASTLSKHLASTSSPSRSTATPLSIFSPPTCLSYRQSEPCQNRITSITNDRGCLVVGSEDNLLDVYKISGSTERLPVSVLAGSGEWYHSPQELKLDHRQVLYGHSGSIRSVASAGDRIVSGGADGNIMVWPLKKSGDASSLIADAHVITLRPPNTVCAMYTDHSSTTVPATLYSLMSQWKAGSFDQKLSPQAKSNIVKWVSTSFDRVLSVSGPSQLRMGKCRYAQGGEEACQEERVQVWSFAA